MRSSLLAIDERLLDSLDAGQAATSEEEREGHRRASLKIIGEYLGFIKGNEIVAHLDENPFVPVGIRADLGSTLVALQAQLTP